MSGLDTSHCRSRGQHGSGCEKGHVLSSAHFSPGRARKSLAVFAFSPSLFVPSQNTGMAKWLATARRARTEKNNAAIRAASNALAFHLEVKRSDRLFGLIAPTCAVCLRWHHLRENTGGRGSCAKLRLPLAAPRTRRAHFSTRTTGCAKRLFSLPALRELKVDQHGAQLLRAASVSCRFAPET
ncbi:hypothetical protein MRX96_030657 [Rhipicephalus microplus]